MGIEIHWIEDQPSIRPVKLQIEQSGLISDLVALIEKHNLNNARGNMQIEFPKGTKQVYECAVVRNTLMRLTFLTMFLLNN